MSALWLTLAVLAQSPVDFVSSEATLYLEVNDRGVQAEESWAVRNMGSLPVPAQSLVIALPQGVQQTRAEGDGSSGFEVSKDSQRIVATAPLPPGETRMITVRYMLPLPPYTNDLELPRVTPFSVGRWRVIMEAVPRLSVSANHPVNRSERELNGVKFALWELDQLAPGTPVRFMFENLPGPSPWGIIGRIATTGFAIGILAWAVIRSRQGLAAARAAAKPRATDVVTPLSGPARRERLVRAVELLDQDLASGKLEPEQHARRRRALVGELAVVMRQIDLESRAPTA